MIECYVIKQSLELELIRPAFYYSWMTALVYKYFYAYSIRTQFSEVKKSVLSVLRVRYSSNQTRRGMSVF
jgi:hypothetical protein